MRNFYSFNLIWFWLLGVAVPYLFYFLDILKTETLATGIYDGVFAPDTYLHTVAVYLTVVIGASLTIAKIIDKDNTEICNYPVKSWYIYLVLFFAVAYRLFLWVKLGGGENVFNYVLNGGINGTAFGYFGLVMSINDLIILYLFCAKSNVNWGIIAGCFIFYSVLCVSRSGFLFCIYCMGVCFLVIPRFRCLRRIIVWLVVIGCILSPIAFTFSTINRGVNVDDKLILSLIDGRCSQLELSGIALWKSEQNEWNKEFFDFKYGVKNQGKMCINAMVPGDFFESDVDPNQYYRSVFLNKSVEYAKNHYTSANITLPVYFVIKYGELIGLVLSVGLLVLWFVVCRILQGTGLGWLLAFHTIDIITFFDWVVISRSLLTMFMTYLMFRIVNEFSESVFNETLAGK